MKFRTSMWMTVVYLFAALAMPVWTVAQDNSSPNHHHRHHTYRFIDLGTFGGPASELTTNNGVGAGAKILSDRGILTGSADTSIPDPYSPNCFNASCFVSRAFRWEHGSPKALPSLSDDGSSQGTAVSEFGWIAGGSQTGDIDPIIDIGIGHAVLYRGRRLTDLGTLGGYESFAVSVNDAGEVAGFSTVLGPIDPYSFLGQSVHGFIWRHGVMQDVGTLGGPDTFLGIGHELVGEVVGSSFTDSVPNPTTGIPTLHPFIWRNGHIRDLGTLGGTLCCQGGFTANSRGQIASDSNLAGDLQSHPFLWDRGRMIDLGTFGGDHGFAFNINSLGHVVGNADFPGSLTHDAFLWRHGTLIDLGNLGVTSSAFALNDYDQVVGGSRIDDTPGNGRAFLSEDGEPMVDLNALIPNGSPLLLIYATNINNRGEIAGLGVPEGCAPADYLLCGHAYMLLPRGFCDDDCEDRIRESQDHAALLHSHSVVEQRGEPVLSPAERFRNQMRQRHGTSGQRSRPND